MPAQTSLTDPRFLDFPYGAGGNGTPNTVLADDHLRDLILQVLFTNPGERVNLPEFGAGLQRLVFEPNSDALRSGVQFLISTNLQRWLGDRINVDQVNVSSVPGEENTVTIEIAYTLKQTLQQLRIEIEV